MLPLGRSSKKLVPSVEEYVEESGKQNNQSPVPGVENQNGCEIRTTSVLRPSSSHHHISLQKKKKNNNNMVEKGKKEKKHVATGKVEQEVGTKC
ncbi:hypothetical protein DY000_02046728 [Brassica cretica]|uniref:Uncharacterized protein n=1 Tax=Brassica cretica TaxID=69181 RepID=A0ABQ7ER86_BRACR|nr:hypothetical protein DY000_02046728 [Brassica cretica]